MCPVFFCNKIMLTYQFSKESQSPTMVIYRFNYIRARVSIVNFLTFVLFKNEEI